MRMSYSWTTFFCDLKVALGMAIAISPKREINVTVVNRNVGGWREAGLFGKSCDIKERENGQPL